MHQMEAWIINRNEGGPGCSSVYFSVGSHDVGIDISISEVVPGCRDVVPGYRDVIPENS